MKPASQKLTKYVHEPGRWAKRSTSVGSASSATKKVVSLKTATRKRSWMGRSVLLGDNVKDQDFNRAEFCELGSGPPSLDAAKALDVNGVPPWAPRQDRLAMPVRLDPVNSAGSRHLGHAAQISAAETLEKLGGPLSN